VSNARVTGPTSFRWLRDGPFLNAGQAWLLYVSYVMLLFPGRPHARRVRRHLISSRELQCCHSFPATRRLACRGIRPSVASDPLPPRPTSVPSYGAYSSEGGAPGLTAGRLVALDSPVVADVSFGKEPPGSACLS